MLLTGSRGAPSVASHWKENRKVSVSVVWCFSEFICQFPRCCVHNDHPILARGSVRCGGTLVTHKTFEAETSTICEQFFLCAFTSKFFSLHKFNPMI